MIRIIFHPLVQVLLAIHDGNYCAAGECTHISTAMWEMWRSSAWGHGDHLSCLCRPGMKRTLSCPNYGASRVSHRAIPWSLLSILMCETKDAIRVRNQTRRLLENSTTHSSRSSRADAGVVLLAESQRPTGRRCRHAPFLGRSLQHLFVCLPLLELGPSVSVGSGLLM